MKIKKLHIQNYKSLVNLEIIEPNPFTVFAGSNGAGKSNIFEALEFLNFANSYGVSQKFINDMFFGVKSILNKGLDKDGKVANVIRFDIELEYKHSLELHFKLDDYSNTPVLTGSLLDRFGNSSYALGWQKFEVSEDEPKYDRYQGLWHQEVTSLSYKQIINEFYRIYPQLGINRTNAISPDYLNVRCDNLVPVLKKVLSDKFLREEICSWLSLLIPGFNDINIESSKIDGKDELIIYENGTKIPFEGNLLSDGTKNILALLTAVYQSNENTPQFLCIEEPENGLNPKVQKELVNLFRQKCEDEGHYIWLNTHSQTIVNQLTPKELILVDKVDGETKIKQLTDSDTSGLSMDEAWLTNTLGGGIPW